MWPITDRVLQCCLVLLWRHNGYSFKQHLLSKEIHYGVICNIRVMHCTSFFIVFDCWFFYAVDKKENDYMSKMFICTVTGQGICSHLTSESNTAFLSQSVNFLLDIKTNFSAHIIFYKMILCATLEHKLVDE